jgi:hypothetical protein
LIEEICGGRCAGVLLDSMQSLPSVLFKLDLEGTDSNPFSDCITLVLSKTKPGQTCSSAFLQLSGQDNPGCPQIFTHTL